MDDCASSIASSRPRATPRTNIVSMDYSPRVPKRTDEVIRALIAENATDVKRQFKKADVARTGVLPVEVMVRVVMNTLTLNPQRDAMALVSVCEQAAKNGMVAVNDIIQPHHAEPMDTARYKAAGIMDSRVQVATTGITATPLGYRYAGPPYAVSADADQMTNIIQDFHAQRKGALAEKLKKHSSDGVWLTHKEFFRAMPEMDKYQVPDYEITALIEALDPGRKRGRIHIERFISQFGSEYLKNKSSRATIGGNIDGDSNTLQWPASLDDSYDKKRVMDTLRNRRVPRSGMRPKRPAPPTSGSSRGRPTPRPTDSGSRKPKPPMPM